MNENEPKPGAKTAGGLWTQLDGARTEVIKRAEKAASWTLPAIMMEEGANPDDDSVTPLWQSVGAQLVNNLSTRLMLALFAPSRPFLRLDPTDEMAEAARVQGISEEVLRAILAKGERTVVKKLDQMALRPKLYELLKHLIIVGTVLTIMDRKEQLLRVIGLKHFVVKRDVAGRLHTLVLKECVLRDELDQRLLDQLPAEARGKDDEKVDYYTQVIRDPKTGKFNVSYWINEFHLASEDKSYTERECPYKVLTWNLSDEANYGTSLVNEYEGDFAGLTNASAAMIAAAVLASEFRWLVDPSGGVDVTEFEDSANGAAIAGGENAVTLLNAAGQMGQVMATQQSIITDYVNRLGRGFILTSAITRDAERVTAEEIRLLANELENGLGGGYSRLAVDLQRPLGDFLLDISKIQVDGKQIEVTVITGLDALSRSGDLEALRGWLLDLQSLNTVPEDVRATLDISKIVLDLATPRGVEAAKYVKNATQVEDEANRRVAREAAGQAAARGATQA